MVSAAVLLKAAVEQQVRWGRRVDRSGKHIGTVPKRHQNVDVDRAGPIQAIRSQGGCKLATTDEGRWTLLAIPPDLCSRHEDGAEDGESRHGSAQCKGRR